MMKPSREVRKARKARCAIVKAIARNDALRGFENSRQYADETMYYYEYVRVWENVYKNAVSNGILG